MKIGLYIAEIAGEIENPKKGSSKDKSAKKQIRNKYMLRICFLI